MKTTRIIRVILIVAGAMWGAAGRAEAGSLAINVQIGGGSFATLAAQAAEVPVTMIWNNKPAAAVAAPAGMGRYFQIDVPDGQTYLNVLTTGGWGDCDVYLARGYLPTPTRNDFAATDPGTEQQVTVLYPAWGSWYVLVHGARQYGGVTVMSSFWQQTNVYYDEPVGTFVPPPLGARSVRVCIAWDRLGWRRGDCGLIPFIQRELRDRHEVSHHLMRTAPVGVVRDLRTANRVELPAPGHIERVAPSKGERPVVGPVLNRNERPAATGRNPLQDRPAAVAAHPAAVTHAAAPAPVAAREQRIESHATPAPMPTLTRAAAPDYSSARSAGPAAAHADGSHGRTSDSARDSGRDSGTSGSHDHSGHSGK
jgi:hypothetical protein